MQLAASLFGEEAEAAGSGAQPAAAAQGDLSDLCEPVLGGAAAEVEALLEQTREKDVQVRVLQRSLAEAKTELDDLKTLISSCSILVGVGIVFASLPSEWWAQTFSQLAATELVA